MKPLVIGIAGGSGSGKTNVTNAIIAAVGAENVTLLQEDSYYRDFGDLSPAQRRAIHDEEGNTIFGTNSKIAGVAVPVADGDGQVMFDFDHIPLLDGTYLVTLAIQSTDEGTVYDWSDQQYQFSVMNPARTHGIVALPMQVRFSAPYAERLDGGT